MAAPIKQYCSIYVFLCFVMFIGKISTQSYVFHKDDSGAYLLPALTYEYSSLEPYIDEATVKAHHGGHHLAYTTNLNKALEEWKKVDDEENAISQKDILVILQKLDDIRNEFRTRIINHGGGFVNHAVYWSNMSPNSDGALRKPDLKLTKDIEAAFGKFATFKQEFDQRAKTLFGSGYVWLVRDMYTQKLSVVTTLNQDCPLSYGQWPLLCLDVWEHAYYLQHQFRRPSYIEKWWYLVDWSNVARLDAWWQKHEPQYRDEL